MCTTSIVPRTVQLTSARQGYGQCTEELLLIINIVYDAILFVSLTCTCMYDLGKMSTLY